jgi:predicted MFS family arabinose efflux permease
MSSFAESIRRHSLATATQVAFYGIALTSLAWVLFSSPVAIGLIQFFNGIFWSGLDLCLILWIQSAIPTSARRLMGIYVALCQMASVLGSLAGAELLRTYHLSNFQLIEMSTALRWILAIGLSFALSARLSRQTSFDESGKFLIYLFVPSRLREGIRLRLNSWL